MIGVIANESDRLIIEEFFELFKTPWEFYDSCRSYDVVISTVTEVADCNAKLIFIFGSTPRKSESDPQDGAEVQDENVLLQYEHTEFPVYGRFSTFDNAARPIILVRGSAKAAGIEISGDGKKIIRIGYDLFDEISFILWSGQPAKYALYPTLEVHISILKSLILRAGLPVVEIPPVPEGYAFAVALTHDVDFLGIRQHKLDRSVLGFISRVFAPCSLRNFFHKRSWSKLLKNIRALLSIPGIHLGLCRDFWMQLDRYSEIERGLASTFYFIPFKGCAGEISVTNSRPPRYRAAKYDISHYVNLISKLMHEGREIGLHGIDAWDDPAKGRKEREVIAQITGNTRVGVRMHWLYFSEKSPIVLQESGFDYDSSIGYNDAVGYRSGTAQVFMYPGVSNFFELPLHIQDTALFYRKRMRLSEEKASALCNKIIEDMRTYGGVLTINWHQRSLAPERNWDEFYEQLLSLLKRDNVWFATAKQAVCWFQFRRSIRFEECEHSESEVRVKLKTDKAGQAQRPLLRVHVPESTFPGHAISSHGEWNFVDIPWGGEPETLVRYSTLRACGVKSATADS